MKNETRRYRLTGITELLGSQPSDDQLFTNYIASKAPQDIRDKEIDDRAANPDYADLETKGLTVFQLDPKSGALTLNARHIRGFFKETIRNLQEELGILMAASKVDRYLFADPRLIILQRPDKDGVLQPIMEDDGRYERPLRITNRGGIDETTITASEQVYDPWVIDVELTLFPNKGTTRSKALTWDAVETALDYGRFNGLGQFRTGGYGRFTWERLNDGKS